MKSFKIKTSENIINHIFRIDEAKRRKCLFRLKLRSIEFKIYIVQLILVNSFTQTIDNISTIIKIMTK